MTPVKLKNKVQSVWRETLAIHRDAPETSLASSLSAIEIFVALCYGNVPHFNPKEPLDAERDRCIIWPAPNLRTTIFLVESC